MIHKVAVAILLIFFYTEFVDARCGTHNFWRNHDILCPEWAICADVIEGSGYWGNGTACKNKEIHHNCFCPVDFYCPASDPDHKIHYTQLNTRILCQPICDLPWCDRYTPTMLTIWDSPEFDNIRYDRIQCRCPRHHHVSLGNLTSDEIGSPIASLNPDDGLYYNYHICTGFGSEFDISLDPCVNV